MQTDSHDQNAITESEMIQQYKDAMDAFPPEFTVQVKKLLDTSNLGDSLANRILVLAMAAAQAVTERAQLEKAIKDKSNDPEPKNFNALRIGITRNETNRDIVDAVCILGTGLGKKVVKLAFVDGQWGVQMRDRFLQPSEFREYVSGLLGDDENAPPLIAVAVRLINLLDYMGSNEFSNVENLIDDASDNLAKIAVEAARSQNQAEG